jgi:hypothetical protein
MTHTDSATLGQYVLDDNGNPVAETDPIKWARIFSSPDRFLKQETLPDGTSISTVFLGIDHNHSGRGPPILWETMIFGGRYDQFQWRYASREEALAGHQRAVELARKE